MNKNTGIVVGVIALVVIAGGIYASTNKKDGVMMAKESMEQKAIEANKMADEKAIMEKKAMEEKDAMMKVDPSKTDGILRKDETSTSNSMMKVGSYEVYSADKLARVETGDVVLFFHASWCPSCRGLNSSIEANLKSIPEGVTILKTDYDKETELKKKYGVTYQHTLVQVDKNGNMIKKWSGGSTITNLLSQIQ